MPKSTIIPLLHHQQERGKEYLQAFLGQRRVGVVARKHKLWTLQNLHWQLLGAEHYDANQKSSLILQLLFALAHWFLGFVK